MKILKRICIGLVVFFVALYALIWALSPVAARYVLGDVLAQHNLTLDNNSQVRVNLFWSRLSISNVYLRNENSETYALKEFQVDYSVWRLFAKEVRINKIALTGMSLSVDKSGSSLNVAGIHLSENSNAVEQKKAPEKKTLEENTSSSLLDSLRFFAPNVVFKDIVINIRNDGHPHTVNINTLEIKNSVYHQQKLDSNVSLDAEVDGIKLEFTSTVNVIENNINADILLDISNIETTTFLYLLPDTIGQLKMIGDFNVASKIAITDSSAVVTDTNLVLTISDLNYLDTKVNVDLANTKFTLTDFSATALMDGTIQNLQSKSSLVLQTLDVALAQSKDKILVLDVFDSNELSLAAENSNFTLTGPQIILNKFAFSQVASREDSTYLFSTDRVYLNGLHLAPTNVSLQSFELGGSRANVVFDKTGNLDTLIDFSTLTAAPVNEVAASKPIGVNKASTQANEPSAATLAEAQANSDAVQIKLEQFLLTSPLTIAIEDKRNAYTFKKQFEITELQIDNVDSSRADQKSEFLIKAKDQEYFRSNVSGWVKPFGEKVNVKVNGELKEFPLHEVAPYLRDSLGFEVASGQLDTDINAKVTNNKLDSTVEIFLRGANFVSSQKENSGANIIGQTAVPLNVALDMLKDSDGNIKLKLPIDGDINSPNFSVRHVVGLVLKKVALRQAKNTLMNMFVPYAQVVSVAMVAGEAALKVRFEDLVYSPQQIVPAEPQAVFIQQMTKLLQDKPDLRVNVCAISTPEDIQLPLAAPLNQEQQQQLLDIAKQRGNAFKAKLVQEGGIDSARLLLCSPKVDNGKKAKPKLDFKT